MDPLFFAKFTRGNKYDDSGDLVVIKKLLGKEEEDKRLFLKEAKILQGLNYRNVVQFQAICEMPSAIMLEYLCFDFSLFGRTSEPAYSLDDYIHFVDRCDAFRVSLSRENFSRHFLGNYLSTCKRHRSQRPKAGQHFGVKQTLFQTGLQRRTAEDFVQLFCTTNMLLAVLCRIQVILRGVFVF